MWCYSPPIQLLTEILMWCLELKLITIQNAPTVYGSSPSLQYPSSKLNRVGQKQGFKASQPLIVLAWKLGWKCISFTHPLFLFHLTLCMQGKTRNFVHSALKNAIIEFFYNRTCHITDKCPDLFCKSVPLPCLVLVASAVRNPHTLKLC